MSEFVSNITGMIVEEPVPNQEGGFKCIRCNLAFMSRELLLKHMTMKLHIDIVAEELKDLIGDDQVNGVLVSAPFPSIFCSHATRPNIWCIIEQEVRFSTR